MITTWLCSCGSGACAPHDTAGGGVPVLGGDQVPARAPPPPGRRSGDARSAPVSAQMSRSPRSTALACACSICSRCHASPSAHTAETDFGALNVKSIPPPRPPSAPVRTEPRPAAGVAALHQRHEVRAVDRLAGLDPQPRERLGVGEPAAGRLRRLAVRGSGSSRRAPARRSCPPDSGRTRRPWRHRCSLRSSHPIHDHDPPNRPTNLHSASHSARTGVHLRMKSQGFARTFSSGLLRVLLDA